MSAPEFFIADDAHGDPWVWRENGDRPIQVLNLLHVAPEHAALLNLIRAAVEGEVREEWDVRLNVPSPYSSKARELVVVRRTVITGAWEEER